ncbi:L-seryl-tRNA(Sec) selenium transferase [Ornithinimicrobium ciconiae]|uniref:L-seryl-tRNA(Sec) selenium transferase n=1 Tax=Ornithinimicrobium ciconiae TaxID=2594265 RepID=A0A516GCJ9_9MICO|nr:L-seryl-tRNA(Sec) selenium transferase [Ornithinimicrobium ciconiae]QDO89256.1 L-seryl-tRNA(Sec) selenium transferase [Ornithinimicrobium ciconiae]
MTPPDPHGQDDPRRRIPRTDDLLTHPTLTAASPHLGRSDILQAIHAAQDLARQGQIAPEDVLAQVIAALPGSSSAQRPVLNATGVVVHTNLGRAPLSHHAIEAVVRAAGYSDLEFDLQTGQRGTRGEGVLAALRRALPEGTDALVVNNGAAALLLAVTTLAAGREVVVSRGELVEIGDGFRLPDLMVSTGARLREVGTTNRTGLADYAAAVGAETGAVVKIHPSNFRIEGFSSEVAVADLATLDAPVIVDIGSGLLAPDPQLPDEPDATSALRAGAQLVTASADKLLGGPQAGLVLGETGLVQRLRRHPLARALRVDKLTLAALEATLRGGPAPVTTYRTAPEGQLQHRASALASQVGGRLRRHDGLVGGGGAPGVVLPGWAVALPAELALPLRTGDPAVVGRVEADELLLDLRCVPEESDDAVAAAVLSALDAGRA